MQPNYVDIWSTFIKKTCKLVKKYFSRTSRGLMTSVLAAPMPGGTRSDADGGMVEPGDDFDRKNLKILRFKHSKYIFS